MASPINDLNYCPDCGVFLPGVPHKALCPRITSPSVEYNVRELMEGLKPLPSSPSKGGVRPTLDALRAENAENAAADGHASMKGAGGAPMRATTLPNLAADRKQFPIASGVLDYFPDALVAISYVSYRGNEQHNPGKLMYWDRDKSGDESDTLIRHFLARGTLDSDGVRHSAKMAWRALALLQKEIEAENG